MKNYKILLPFCFMLFYSLNLLAQSDEAVVIKNVDNLIANKIVKVNYEVNKAFVDPGVWNAFDIDQKTKLGILLGLYCSYKNRDKDKSCTIYDLVSGKKLAKWSDFMGELQIEK
jgi:hypothetical protein